MVHPMPAESIERNVKDTQAAARHHREAAEFFEQSASNHRLAAEAYEAGDAGTAERLADEAARLDREGLKHSEEAKRLRT
jgi:hypothetical protein